MQRPDAVLLGVVRRAGSGRLGPTEPGVPDVKRERGRHVLPRFEMGERLAQRLGDPRPGEADADGLAGEQRPADRLLVDERRVEPPRNPDGL